MVIADRLALYRRTRSTTPAAAARAGALIIATYFFAFQIYCDFSGYSDIAIGAAQVMGFELMDEFRPALLRDVDRRVLARWHISLSTWFRDYLYIPLGGNRVRGAALVLQYHDRRSW